MWADLYGIWCAGTGSTLLHGAQGEHGGRRRVIDGGAAWRGVAWRGVAWRVRRHCRGGGRGGSGEQVFVCGTMCVNCQGTPAFERVRVDMKNASCQQRQLHRPIVRFSVYRTFYKA